MIRSAALIVAAIYLCGHWLAGLSVAVLLLIWRMLPAREGPPVLALAMTTQWTQVTIGVFYAGLTGRPMVTIERSEYQPMVLMGLASVVALTVGLAAGRTWVWRPDAGRRPAELASWNQLFGAYLVAVVTRGVLQQVAWSYPTLTQAILAFGFIHLALLFLVLRRLVAPTLESRWIAGLLAFEVALGFTGYFSDFKEPLLLGVLALLETFDSRRLQHWGLGAACAAVLGLACVMWLAVRAEYRQDFDTELFSASRVTRLERVQALMTDWLRERSGGVSEVVDDLVDRGWAIYYPALAVARVPAVLPHTGGQIMGDAIVHLVTPRILFPNKPELMSDSEMVRRFSGVMVAGAEHNTSIAFGYVAESYVDFGVPLMFLPMLVFGIGCGAAYEWFLRTIRHRELAVSLVTVVFWLGLFLFERAWARTLGLTITMMVYLGGISFLLDRWLLMHRDEHAQAPEIEAGAATIGGADPW
jgi:hypothetical protein